jgi:glutamate-1-semialdehyde 2,1-aminomutase
MTVASTPVPAPAPGAGGPDARIDALIEAEEARFLARTTGSRRLLAEAVAVLPGGVASSWQSAPPQAVWVQEGRGSQVVDVDGNTYVDLHNGFGAMLVGHAHPAVVRAVQDRAARGTHFAQPVPDLIPVATELARRFRLPRWRFANSGTEATLEAVQLMRAATGRPRILKVEGTYHGHHDAVLVSVYPEVAEAGPASRPRSVPEHAGVPEEVARWTTVVPFGDLAAVEAAFAAHPGEIAGMIVEPIMMNVGIITPPPGYLPGLIECCHRHGALVAFDEVKTGLTIAPGGAVEHFDLAPDIVCLAKAMGGGLPCGAIGGTAEVMALIEDGRYEQVGTFNGNPLTMAAARATLCDVLTADAYAHLEHLRARMTEGAERVLADTGLVGYVQALGAKGVVVFRDRRLRDYRDFAGYDARWGHAHWLVQHNGGVFLPPWGKCEQWTLSVQHTDDDVDRFVANLAAFARAVTA